MQIHVARPPAQLGVFSPEEVAEGLRTGRFLPTDQGWREGMAAWAPLGQWDEFRASAVPASPVGGVVSSPSQVPWEQGKSAGSFFATLKGAVVRPRETFAHARMELGDWLIYAYFTQLVILPLRLLQAFGFEDPNAQLARFLEGIDNPTLAPIVEQMRLNGAVAAKGQFMAFKALGLVIGVGLAPLVIAAFGVLVWIGAWVCRLKVELGRTVAATLMAYSITVLALAPFGLLGFNLILLLAVGCLLWVPMMMLYCRAQGAALQRSAWAMFGVNFLIWFLFVACVFCAAFGLVFAAKGVR